MARTKSLPGISDPKLLAAYSRALCFLRRKYVTGVSVGIAFRGGIRNGTGICVHVVEKRAKRDLPKRSTLPRSIGGVRVDVIECSHAAHLMSDAEIDARRVTPAAPVPPGVAISATAAERGTFGMVVVDTTAPNRGRCILTAAHVLTVPTGSDVFQPSPAASGGKIGRVVRGLRTPTCDAAIVSVGARVVTNLPMGSGRSIRGIRAVQKGDILAKSGCMTGLTRAEVSHVGKFEIRFSDGPRNMEGFQLMPIAGGPQMMSMKGDSGAIWYDERTGLAVGLNIAGNSLDLLPWAFASHLTSVFSELKIDVA